jgi:hypothetical protein
MMSPGDPLLSASDTTDPHAYCYYTLIAMLLVQVGEDAVQQTANLLEPLDTHYNLTTSAATNQNPITIAPNESAKVLAVLLLC